MALNYGMPLQGSSPTTSASSGTSTSAIVGGGLMSPSINLSGFDGRTAAQAKDQLSAYGIDIYADIKYHKTERHPSLSILAAGAKPVDHFEFLVTDSYENENYMDMEFDRLRSRVATLPNSLNFYSGYTGGSAVTYAEPNRLNASAMATAGALRFSAAVTTERTATTGTLVELLAARTNAVGAATQAPLLTTEAIVSNPITYGTDDERGGAGTMQVIMGFGKITSNTILGNGADITEKMRANLVGLGYTATSTYVNGGVTWTGVYNAGRASEFYMMFDNLCIYEATSATATSCTTYQLNGIKIAVADFWYNVADESQFFFVLDLKKSNIDIAWTDTYVYNLQFKEYSFGESVRDTYLTTATNGVTYISPVGLMGDISDYVEGVPEGSSKQSGYSFKRNFSSKTNFTQIFRQPAWSLTKTKAAARSSRFIDEWKDTRDRNLAMYKDKIAGQMLWGIKSEKSVLVPASVPNAGRYETVRTMGGLLDRSLWPIRYFKYSLPTIGSTAAESAVNLTQYMDDMAAAQTAFMTDRKNKKITIVCSPNYIRSLRRIAAHSQSFGPNIFGYAATGSVQKGSMDLGFDVTTFRTAYGEINFIEDPALEYMTKFRLPYGISSSAVSPRNIAFALDMGSITMRTLRNDTLQGNLMLPGEDIALEEDIIGEHSLEVTKARHQSLIIFD